jgi:hypothetical protein
VIADARTTESGVVALGDLDAGSWTSVMRERADQVLEWVFGLIGGAIVLAIVLLVNGGYVYRTKCARAGSSVETECSCQIFSFIPYSGYSRSGCEVHSSTRVALDVW